MIAPIPKPEKRVKQPKTLRKVGRHGLRWLKFRKQYLIDNPPNARGCYTCYYCLFEVEARYITLDHIIPRSRRPDLLTDPTNIRFACFACNSQKGSKTKGY